jgi:predicted metal-dependent phosphoesterase TrpH
LRADLHIHTTASDGTDTPEEVVAQAAAIGLEYIAITDHDTLEGIDSAREAGKRHNVGVLAAIELSAEYKNKEVHILGYSIDTECKIFSEKIAFLRDTRINRLSKIIDKLKENNIFLEEERVIEIAGGGSVGRPHIARAMMEKGIVLSVNEAFNLYLGYGKVGYVTREKYSVGKAINIISEAKGIPVLAHPGNNIDQSYIKMLIDRGLKGIEAYHPSHDAKTVRTCLDLAEKHHLLATGGSDYHGKDKAKNLLGCCWVPVQVVDEIKAMAGI